MSVTDQTTTICLTVVGRERPGIVAGITGVLLDTDCNIRDSTMTLLQGEFAMMIIVELPEGMSPRALERALFDMQRRFDLTVATRRLDSDEASMPRPNPSTVWAVTTYGGHVRGQQRPLGPTAWDGRGQKNQGAVEGHQRDEGDLALS